MGSIVQGHQLTGTRINQVLRVVPETGKIYWKKQKRVLPGSEAGTIKHGNASDGGGYRVITVDQKQYRAHHIVWAYCTGAWPTNEIDHKNGERDDNRFENLRDATVIQNRQNKRIQSNNRSGYKWVYWCNQHQTWRAEIRHSTVNGKRNRKRLFFASGPDPIKLHAMACAAARKFYGEFYNDGG